MQPLQRLFDDNGNEVMLFPMEYMNISQGEGGSLSHDLAMDFLGWNSLGRVYDCPYYAPCSCQCVFSFGTGDNRTWTSLNHVHCADGNLRTITFCFNHDENPPAVGSVRTQGDLIGHSGTAGYVTGDHMHFNTATGTYDGYERIGTTQFYQLKHSNHIYNTCYVNNTVIIDGNGYDWKIFEGGSPTPPTPPEEKKHKFPWFMYRARIAERTIV